MKKKNSNVSVMKTFHASRKERDLESGKKKPKKPDTNNEEMKGTPRKRVSKFSGEHVSKTAQRDYERKHNFTFRDILKSLTSKTSLIYLAISFVFAGLVALTLIWGFQFFSIVVEFYICTLCLMTFAILVMSHHDQWDGFFLIIGFGYGFFSVLRLIYLCTYPWVDAQIVSNGRNNQSTQLRISFDALEVLSLFIGLVLANIIFKSRKVVFITISVDFIYTIVVLCSVFWWEDFPTCYTLAGGFTTFKRAFDWITPAAFLCVAATLVWRRHSFSVDTFTFLFLAIIVRTISIALNIANDGDFQDNGMNKFTFLMRMLAFAYIFCCVGIATLQNPTKTLYRNLSSHQRALRKEKTFAEWMIDQMPAIVVLLDQNGQVTHTNRVAKDLLDVNPENVLGKNFMEQFVGRSAPKTASRGSPTNEFTFANLLANARAGQAEEKVTFEAVYPGTSRIIEWRFASLDTSSKKHTTPAEVGTADVGGESEIELEDSESQSTHSSDSQDDRVVILCLGQDVTRKYEREALLTKARNDAQRLAEMKDTFVANVSHELRTPLNCIVGVSSLLVGTELNTHQKDMLSMISNAASVLLDLINDLLDVNSIRQGTLKLNYGTINLRKFIEELIFAVSLHPHAVENLDLDFGYRVQFKCPIEFETDQKRLRQVLVNLLSNAIKFTAKGQVVLTVNVVKKRDSPGKRFLQFKVQDSGMGIKPEDISRLFQRFSQLDNTNTRKFQGTGIGLHISKQLVEMMGGDIGVESVMGKGSTFYFILPLDSDVLLPAKSHSKVEQSEQTVYVLYQNRVVGHLICKNLAADCGYAVHEVESVSDLNKLLQRLLNAVTQTNVDKGIAPHPSPRDLIVTGDEVMNSPRSNESASSYYKSLIVPDKDSERSLILERNTDPPKRNESDPTYNSPKKDQSRTEEKSSSAPDLSAYVKKKAPRKLSIVMEFNDLASLNIPLLKSFSDMFKTTILIVVILPKQSPTDIAPTVNKEEYSKQNIMIETLARPVQLSWLIEALTEQETHSEEERNRSKRLKQEDKKEEVKKEEEVIFDPKKILVVEDNLVNQKVIRMQLSKFPWITMDMANNGLEAVNKFRDNSKYDLILMDCQMPVMDGYQATREIRKLEQDEGRERTTIFAITANAMEESQNEWVTIGMDGYIVKPVDFNTLKSRLYRVFNLDGQGPYVTPTVESGVVESGIQSSSSGINSTERTSRRDSIRRDSKRDSNFSPDRISRKSSREEPRIDLNEPRLEPSESKERDSKKKKNVSMNKSVNTRILSDDGTPPIDEKQDLNE